MASRRIPAPGHANFPRIAALSSSIHNTVIGADMVSKGDIMHLIT
jgi:hypothetical protein